MRGIRLLILVLSVLGVAIVSTGVRLMVVTSETRDEIPQSSFLPMPSPTVRRTSSCAE